MNKTVHNYLNWELGHLNESIDLVERYAAGEVMIINKRWIMRILRFNKAVSKIKDTEDQGQLITQIAKELGYKA